jgi:hypothetical protein
MCDAPNGEAWDQHDGQLMFPELTDAVLEAIETEKIVNRLHNIKLFRANLLESFVKKLEQ